MRKIFPYRFRGIFGQIFLVLIAFTGLLGTALYHLINNAYQEKQLEERLKRGYADIATVRSGIEETLSEIQTQMETVWLNSDCGQLLVAGTEPEETSLYSMASVINKLADNHDGILSASLILPYSERVIVSGRGVLTLEESPMSQWILNQSGAVLMIGGELYYCQRYPEEKTLGVLAVQLDASYLVKQAVLTSSVYVYNEQGEAVFSQEMDYPESDSLMVSDEGEQIEEEDTWVFSSESGSILVFWDSQMEWYYVHREADFSAAPDVWTLLWNSLVYGIVLLFFLTLMEVFLIWRICQPLQRALVSLVSGQSEKVEAAGSEVSFLYEIAAANEKEREKLQSTLKLVGDAVCEKALHRLFCDSVWEEDEIRGVLKQVDSPLLQAQGFAVIELYGYGKRQEAISDYAWEFFYLQLTEFCREYFEKTASCYPVRVSDQEVCLLLSGLSIQSQNALDREMKIFGGWLQKKFTDTEFSLAIGWSTLTDQLFEAAVCRAQAKELLNKSIYYMEEGSYQDGQEESMQQFVPEIESLLNVQMQSGSERQGTEQLELALDRALSYPEKPLPEMIQLLTNVLAEKLIQFQVSVPTELETLRWNLQAKSTDEELLKKQLTEAYVSGIETIRRQGKKEQYAYITKAKQYIEQNYYDSSLSLITVGQALGISPQYLSRLFTEYQPPGFLDYLNRCRLKQARHLLDETTWMVSEIGLKSGFNSANSFIRVFKKYEGETPGQYRAKRKAELYE